MIILKTRDEVEKLRRANIVVADFLDRVQDVVAPGVSTLDLDAIAEDFCRVRGAKPAFKGYKGFPSSICVSVNEEVVHGIPSKRTLKEGDVVSVDFGVVLDGYYGDSAKTFAVGAISEDAQELLRVTEESLMLAIKKALPGNRLYDISHAVQSHVENAGFSVVRDFVGHGIGRSMHEEPQIPNYGKPGRGVKLCAGMVLAIEPMVTIGSPEVEVLGDGWTAVTKDRRLAAHFEHSIAILDDGVRILSASTRGET